MKYILNTIVVITLLTKACAGQFTFERTYNYSGLNTQGRGCQILSDGFAIAADLFPCGLCTKSTMYLKADSAGNIVNVSAFPMNPNSYTDFIHKCFGDTFIIAGSIENMNIIADDTYLVKCDENGSMIWRKQFTADTLNSDMYPLAMCNTVDSCYYMLYSVNASGIRYMKISPNGDSLLSKKIGYPFLYAGDMISLHDDGFAILGSRDNGSQVSRTILRLNTNGDTLHSFDLNLDSVGVVSQFVETLDYGFAILGNLDDSIRNYPMTIWKLDSLGNILWRKSLVKNELLSLYKFQNCSDNGFIVTGNEYLPNNLLWNTAFLYRTNDTGDSVWYKNFQSQSNGRLEDVKQLPDNGFLAVGKIVIGFNDPSVFIIRTDSSGNVSSLLSSPEINEKDFLTLYPNPAHDNFVISVPDMYSEYSFTIFDVFGRNVLQIPEVRNGYIIPVSGFAKGFYNIIIKTGSESFTSKLIIE